MMILAILQVAVWPVANPALASSVRPAILRCLQIVANDLSVLTAYLVSIQHKKNFHCRMSNPLIAIYKWMILDNGISKSNCLFDYIGIQLFAQKHHPRLRKRRL